MACTRKTKKTAAPSNTVSTVFAVPETAADTPPAAAAAEAAETAESPAAAEETTETAEAEAASAEEESAGTASSWEEVPMRRHAHPIPAACTAWGSRDCPCQSCPCQSAEERAYLVRLLRRQQRLLEEIRSLLMQIYPYL